MGIGNFLMSDEGVGIHAVRRLKHEEFPDNVQVLDGGTGGIALMEYFESYKTLVIIDAANDGNPPGSVHVLRPRFVQDFPPSLSAHEFGLRDMMTSAALMGIYPDVYLITVTVENLKPMNVKLSQSVEAALEKVVKAVHHIVRSVQTTQRLSMNQQISVHS
jgi:hydrogenase maturation protease